ncbi:hypothetical protein NDI85_09510 [Halomicroarcula sp. S1AR25-4]|uniref:hypothetical protein n=1 Tax=Haloarcula sp. S1AR25-4 TaxID=2950538 RepID=UPI0028762E97|nr:hypothetical protein [Halomicroarcula sp. S1AR25-4]MDS0278032.1 hypothetical protein [Halomicroarcula sp. S1AR25-4]
MDNYFDRKIISIHDEDELTEAELILKQTLHTTVRKLPLATFRQHEKQGGEDDDDEATDQLTNQSVGGVQRARQLAEQNSDDTLPAVYGGLFTVAEYFTRSFDAIKGKFFEKVIAAEDPSHRLDVDRNLGKLPQYLLEPELCWKSLSYTRETLTDEEEARLEGLSSLTLDLAQNNKQANADATLFRGDTLVFGEHRTSVVSGGTTARPSLMRKPRALVKELAKSNDVVTIERDVADEYGLEARSYSLSSLLKDIGVDNIHIHIGILFDEERRPATWENDPQQSTSHRLIEEFEDDFLGQETGHVQNVNLDSDNLRLEFDVPVESGSEESIHIHLSFLYGDNYLNTLYTGSLDAVGRNGSPDAFEDATGLREIISDNEADDLWLGFSVAERENKAFEMSADGSNNAMEIADMILDDEDLSHRLIRFRKMCRNGPREAIDNELISFATDLAERYYKERDNQWAEWVYGADAEHYLRDVALQVLVYDNISLPIFLRRFPEASPPEPVEDEEDETDPTLSDARYTFEQYLFDIDTDTTKKKNIYRVVRNKTMYHGSGTNIPSNTDDEIDWANAPTKSEIGNILDIRTPTRTLRSMSEGVSSTKGGVLVQRGDKFAVPVSVAHTMGEFMRELPEHAQPD